MTRRFLVPVAAVAALVAIPAASSKSMPIEHGVGIGAIKLGMSGTEVQKRLGRPRAVIERRVVGGQPYVEFEYRLGAWNVGFLGPKGRRRVVLVGTGLSRHRTPEGVGVGTTAPQFWRRMRAEGYRQRRCGDEFSPSEWVLRTGARETVFFPNNPCGWCGQDGPPRVVGVEIRSAPALGCGF